MIATDHDLRRLRRGDQQLTSLFLSFSCGQAVRGLDAYTAAHMESLHQSLQNNSSLTSVSICSDDSFASLVDDLSRYDGILRDIGRLPNLKILQLSAPPNSKGVLPVRCLLLLLSEATNLEILVIHGLLLAGSKSDFDQLAHKFQSLWYLQRLALDELEVEEEKEEDALAGDDLKTTSSVRRPRHKLDALLLSLSILPSLHTLSLTAKDIACPMCAFSAPAFSALFLSMSIKNLNVKNWKWTNPHIIGMAQMLQSNKSLVSYSMGPLEDVTPIVAKALANMLHQNSTMLHLELVLTKMLSDEAVIPIAQALHTDQPQTQLQSLVLKGTRLGRVSKKCQTAFCEMLQKNYTLQRVMLFRKSFLQPTMQLYTRLNAMGRQHLLRCNVRTSWVDVLSAPGINNDLEAIYYFLSSNPSLCIQAMPAAASNKKKRPASTADEVTSSCVGTAKVTESPILRRPKRRKVQQVACS